MSESPLPIVTVVGSLNVDYVATVGRFPSPGETIAAADLEVVFGGKGANQAIAAARQGCEVRLLGSVGNDEMGASYRKYLVGEGISVDTVRTVADARTGSAFINVDDSGENTIVVASGANGMTSEDQVKAAASCIAGSRVLLAQFEVPLAAVVTAFSIANREGVVTVLNPSPIRSTFPWRDVSVGYLIVNEGEADAIFEFVPYGPFDAGNLRTLLEEMRVRTLIVTRGSESTLVYAPESFFEVRTLPILPVDTVGAGDAFAGCLAARLADGESIRDAVRAANCAGALTALGAGAQAPIPGREKVDQHMEQL